MTRFRLGPAVPILGALLVVTAVLRLINLAGSPARLDDEGTYVAQAYALVEWGELAHYTYWYDHPPVGWLQLALWSLVAGPDVGGNAIVATRFFMVIVAILTAALLWILARRLEMPLWASAVAVGIFALSPLAISLSRAVYLDNIAIAWALGAAVLLCSPKRALAAWLGAGICSGIAVLTKETLLLLLPMFAWLVWTRAAPETRRYALAVFTAMFGVVITTYVLMAAVRGELIPGPGHVSLLDGIRFQLWERDPGGAIDDMYSLKRHTINNWLVLDPVLPILAAPIAVCGLFIDRLRPFAVGLVTLVAAVGRPGYLPVPLVLSAIPLIALICAGMAEVAVRKLSRPTDLPANRMLARRACAAGVAALMVAVSLSLWLPAYQSVMRSDDDASMRSAQAWIADSVPQSDRLIVDDALWVDLVRQGRDRRNVVWAYKVDTDQQVQAWAPDGWRDYDWIVSTSSMRANLPDRGVLADAVTHSRRVATFGSGGLRVDLLRIDGADPAVKAVPPAAATFGDQLAARLADSTDAGALSVLQSPRVDQRVLATLAVVAAAEPVLLDGIPAIEGEDNAGTPRREIELAGAGPRLKRLAQFFNNQVGAYAPESVTPTPTGLRVRFPLRTKEIGLAANSPPPGGGTATFRVVDLRRDRSGEDLNLVRIDGTAAGSIHMRDDDTPSAYYDLPAGTYVATTHSAGQTPVIRQVLRLNAGAAYTYTMFSGSAEDEIVSHLAPDYEVPDSQYAGSVRLIAGAGATGPVGLSLTSLNTGDRLVLADEAGYGLVTGYATVPAGEYTAKLTTKDGGWSQQVEVDSGEPLTVVLTDDDPLGPRLETMSDSPVTEPDSLDPPTLSLQQP